MQDDLFAARIETHSGVSDSSRTRAPVSAEVDPRPGSTVTALDAPAGCDELWPRMNTLFAASASPIDPFMASSGNAAFAKSDWTGRTLYEHPSCERDY